MSGTTVLSYHDTCLKESDVALLKGPQWLNDKIISFYFEYVCVCDFVVVNDHSQSAKCVLWGSQEVTIGCCIYVCVCECVGSLAQPDPLPIATREKVWLTELSSLFSAPC